MTRYTCLQKARDPKTNVIMSYQLEDESGARTYVKPLQLKQAMYEGSVSVTNLKLTSDGRLIDCNNVLSMQHQGDIISITNDEISKQIASEVAKLAQRTVHRAAYDTENGREVLYSVLLAFNQSKLSEYKNLGSIPESTAVVDGAYALAVGFKAETRKESYTKQLKEMIDSTVYIGWIQQATEGEYPVVISTEATQKLANTINALLDKYEYRAYNEKEGREKVIKNIGNYTILNIQSYCLPDNTTVKLSRKALGVVEKSVNKAITKGNNTEGLLNYHTEKIAKSSELAKQNGVAPTSSGAASKKDKGLFGMFKR